MPPVRVEQTKLADKSMEIIEQQDQRTKIGQLEKQSAELEAQLEEQRAKLDESAKSMKKGKDALNRLTKKSITELKALANPP